MPGDFATQGGVVDDQVSSRRRGAVEPGEQRAGGAGRQAREVPGRVGARLLGDLPGSSAVGDPYGVVDLGVDGSGIGDNDGPTPVHHLNLLVDLDLAVAHVQDSDVDVRHEVTRTGLEWSG